MLKAKKIKGQIIPLLILLLSFFEVAAQETNHFINSLNAEHLPERGVKLTWNIKYNDTTSFFIVERSLDGQRFEELGRLRATNTKTQFHFIDYKPYIEVSYYRIKVVDYDGKTFVSTLSSVFIAGTGKPELVLYPMPVGNSNTLSLDFQGIDKEFKAMVSITDQFGREVLSQEMEINSFNAQAQLNLEGKLSPGNYHLTVLGHSGQRFKIGKLLQITN